MQATDEIAVLARIAKSLEGLNPEQRKRVLAYLDALFRLGQGKLPGGEK